MAVDEGLGFADLHSKWVERSMEVVVAHGDYVRYVGQMLDPKHKREVHHDSDKAVVEFDWSHLLE